MDPSLLHPDTLLRVLALCVALAGTETLHGIARTVWLVPRVGKERAQRMAIYSGTALAALVCALGVPPLGLRGAAAHLLLGLVLALFMAGFDAALGRWLLRRPWRRVAGDFDPRTGNRLLFGLLALALLPLAVFALRAG